MNVPVSPRSARVIVADDHEWILKILTRIVKDTLPEAQVVSVEDGQQALEAYRQGGCNFLVSNHTMPHVDGATLIREVRAQAADLPILMVSVNPAARADAMAAGANWFLTKEQIMEHLPRLLRGHIHDHGGPASQG